VRLPIYRHLNHRIEVFGLSLLELGLVCLLFLLASSLLHQVRFGSAITLAICFAAGALLRFFHRRFEAHYLEKFVRFVGLPDGLHRRLIRSMKSSKARAS
jgi:hypothetical protein